MVVVYFAAQYNFSSVFRFHIFVLLTSGIFIFKCINGSYLVQVYIGNTRRIPYFFDYKTTKNVKFTFHAVVSFSKFQCYFSSYFETSKYVSRYLLCSLRASKYVICAVFCSLSCNCISGTNVFLFQP